MSITAIPGYLFDTVITLQRRHIHIDSVGGLVETWHDVDPNVPGSVQNTSVTEQRRFNQGKTYVVLRKAYIPITIALQPKDGDRLLDVKTGKQYDVIGVERYQAARKNIGPGHHYKLFLLESDLTTPTS